ncbi:transmembrane amino acid transporter protein-domain-containing protein [Fomes fomentarius]|nr:transmembrane amino acid transporter protein-domain-containing protein [Fomes fomentarius]
MSVKYRKMVWWKAAALMLAETITLGILSIPSVFASVGMVAGCFLVIGLGAIATATGYMIGTFKLRYPHVHNMADAGEVIAGPIGREILGAAQVIFILFICASHVLTGLIAFDTITAGASCSVPWGAVTAIVCLVLSLPRTLNGLAYLSVASFISIMAAVIITMIGVGVAGHPGIVKVTADMSFASAFVAVADIIFAYAGHVVFFTFISEMKKPEDFFKSLYMLQIADTTLYLIVGIVVYTFAGADTVSPALGNTGTTLRKVAYGIALPAILIAGVINGHVCAKLVFVRIFRRNGHISRHMTSHSWTGWLTWIGICFLIWTLAFIIAEAIPFFNYLLGVISAIHASWFTYGVSGIFWFHLTPRSKMWGTWKQRLTTTFWTGIVAMAGFIMVAGLYASISSIIGGYRKGGFPRPFTCANQAL